MTRTGVRERKSSDFQKEKGEKEKDRLAIYKDWRVL